MEYFGAAPGTPLAECLKAVRRSNIAIIVIGTRYGFKDERGTSFTQLEYEEAYRHNKTILAYLIDDEKHPVLPKFFDTGEDAKRLTEFKSLLKERHTCATFSSPQDLALKVGVDLIDRRELGQDDESNEITIEFLAEMPRLLSKAGYNLGQRAHVLDLSDVLDVNDSNILEVRDPMFRELVAVGYLAVSISRGNYNVLRHILTFDLTEWRLFVNLVRHYGVDDESMAGFIAQCQEPMQFRLLARLAGDLALGSCAEPLCRRLLNGPALDKRFAELQEQATPLRDVVRDALGAMPASILPTLEKYVEAARDLERWQQKKVFEAAAIMLRRRVEQARPNV